MSEPLTSGGREKKKPSKARKIVGLCAFILLLAILLVLTVNSLLHIFVDSYYPTYGGYRLFAIVSDSMEPEIMTGDMIVSSKPKGEDEITVGSVITYELKSGESTVLITHRVTEIGTREETGTVYYRTKGDALERTDNVYVEYSDIVGVFTGNKCGFFGYVFGFLQSSEGAIALIIILFIIAVTVIIVKFIGLVSVWRAAATEALAAGGEMLHQSDNENAHTVADVIGIVSKEPKNKADVKKKDKKLRRFVSTGKLPLRPYADDLDESELEELLLEDMRTQNEATESAEPTSETPPRDSAIEQAEANTAAISAPNENAVAASEQAATQMVTEKYEVMRYLYTFTARVTQLRNESKEWYSDVKNELLSYENVRFKTGKRCETFFIGRSAVARLTVRGKTLCISLALDPTQYEGSKYVVKTVKSSTPTRFRITSARRLNQAFELIADAMNGIAVKRAEYEPVDYFIPYEGVVSLMHKGLVRRVLTERTRELPWAASE